jgi:pyruvate formate lyase activating enzyme
MREAAWWTPQPNGQAACDLCPIGCRLRPGQTGPCGTRLNQDGTMLPLHYGQVASLALDPMEKKPLYHFHPGRPILSVAAPGCNLHCLFCQNWSLSQQSGQATRSLAPEDLVQLARAEGAVGVAYTYSEPLVWYEYVRDATRAVSAAGLQNVLVTNGFLNADPLADLLPHIHAANIDLKSLDEVFYRKICKASLEPVLAAVDQFLAAGVHVELTNLVIPGHNDDDAQLSALIGQVAAWQDRHGRAVPLHFSAYRPAWKMDAPPTPRATLLKALEMARRHLDWVYLGNVGGDEGRDSSCPHCGLVVVGRSGHRAEVNLAAGGKCPDCGAGLPFIRD